MSMDNDSMKFFAGVIVKLIAQIDDKEAECERHRNIHARINVCKHCKYYQPESNCIYNIACLPEYNQYYQFEENDNE